MIKALKAWWTNHVQKTMGYLAGTLVSLDLAGLAEPIKALVGEKKYYGIVLAAAVVSTIRAHLAKQQQPIQAPPVPPAS